MNLRRPPLPAVHPGADLPVAPSSDKSLTDVPAVDQADTLLANRGRYVLLLEAEAEAARLEGKREQRVAILKYLCTMGAMMNRPTRKVNGEATARDDDHDYSAVDTDTLRKLVTQ